MPTAQVKGISVVALVRGLRVHREAALPLLPERLHHYLDERILFTSWYPEKDWLELAKVVVQVIADPGYNRFEFIGEEGAKVDLKDTYRAMLRSGDPAAMLDRLPFVWKRYHDSGAVEVATMGARKARVELKGFGHPSEEFSQVLTGYIRELLRVAGAKGVRVVNTVSLATGAAVWDATWQSVTAPE